MAKTATPSGLGIKRNDNKFTLSWKRNNSPSGQQLQWRTYSSKKWNSWHSVSISSSRTSVVIELNWNNHYPTKGIMTRLQFRVRGKKNKTWSSWVKKVFVLEKPKKPTITEELTSSNVTKFTWATTTSTSGTAPFVDIEWQSVLQDGYNADKIKSIANWSTLTDYQTGTGTANYSKSITELSTNIADGSHTRWFRARSRGARGPSDWVYQKHIYAAPQQATVTEVQAVPTSSGTQIRQEWQVDEGSAAFPIDTMTVRYGIDVPATGFTCPSGITWTDIATPVDRGNTAAVAFEVPTALQADQCLWLQTNTTHDNNTTYGVPTLARVGKLSTPSGLSVVVNNVTYKATVTATNNSSVPDSFLAVKYCPDSNPEGFVVGIIAHGQSSVIVQCPDWSAETAIAFKVFAVQGTYTTTSLGGGVTEYRINANMTSDSVNDGGAVPVAPTGVSVSTTNTLGTVQVRWNWTWADADGAEISWADHEDAWESTSEPSTYQISQMRASKWNISGLETGQKWYIRVRLTSGNGDAITYGQYSEMQMIDLSSAPTTPVMRLSSAVISPNGMTTATWAYLSTDGTSQAYAEICEATYVSNVLTYGTKIASTTSAQHIDIYASSVGWQAGEVHYLCLRVQASSGLMSDSWSSPVPVIIAEPLTCTLTSSSLTSTTITEQDENGNNVTRTATVLAAMPITATAAGAGAADEVTVSIERATDYFLERPNEDQFIGYKGETIAIVSRNGNGSVTIERDDLIGMLDDGATYILTATINDELGQAASASIEFEVRWSHQALIPTATITNINDVMSITPVQPTGAVVGDVCDVYRLSVDKPELILQGAAWGTQYVDPYPTIGPYGGYRVVFRSVDGDYITSDGLLAWTDYGQDEGVYYYTPKTIIDFGSDRVELMLDMTLSSEWEKDFQETTYLGGSIKGDWNPAIRRTGTVSSRAIRYLDVDTIEVLHRLADYAGICHVRMPDGSNFHADVEVTISNDFGNSPRTAECTISMTKVDGEGLDGQTYAEWSQGGI